MIKYKKRKKYPGKMTKLERLKSENERLKWDLNKSKEENSNWIKAILFAVGLLLLNYFLDPPGPAWPL
jgi:hypothetical protein